MRMRHDFSPFGLGADRRLTKLNVPAKGPDVLGIYLNCSESRLRSALSVNRFPPGSQPDAQWPPAAKSCVTVERATRA